MLKFVDLKGEEVGSLGYRETLAPPIGSHIIFNKQRYLVKDVTIDYDNGESIIRVESVVSTPHVTYITYEQKEKITGLVRSNELLQAVKLYKDITGASLRESKEYVDNLRLS